MLLSLNWLKDYIKENIDNDSFVSDLTMSGSKVEGYKNLAGDMKNLVVGKVLSVEKHSNADSLVVCKIDAGQNEPLQIVTGAANVVPGALVPVALDNSVVYGGKKIKAGKLRGELSQGMLCSLEELGLTKGDFPYADEDGIFLLEEECSVGDNIITALNLDDTVFEFEITSNRPDCLSVAGLARETAATYGYKMHEPVIEVKGGGGDTGGHLSVTVENGELCQRYSAAVVTDVKIEPSPRWMRERLRASGVRAINNIVDITNYVMLELGQPMHAFDIKHVKDAKIIVRNARKNEKITTLDGVERTLSPEMLVIADAEKPSAIAGIMGGEYSGVYEDTKTIIFESACFERSSTRRTSKKLGLRTESSSRFEKGVDSAMAVTCLKRACQLVEMLGAGKICDNFIDIYKNPKQPLTLPLEAEWTNKFLGTDIPKEDMEKYLIRAGFKVNNGIITVPSFREDVEGKADIAEEIARIYGYNNIETTQLMGFAAGRLTQEQRYEKLIARLSLSAGYSETVTYSFISPKFYDNIRLPLESEIRDSIKIANPLGENTSIMRRTAIPSMLNVLSHNYNNRTLSGRFYEIATEYTPVDSSELPDERKVLVAGSYGKDNDFFTIKGLAEIIFNRSGIKNAEFKQRSDNSTFHPGRYAEIYIDSKKAGIIGEVHPAVLENFEIAPKAYILTLDMETLLKNTNLNPEYKELPKFPALTRDLAIVCPEELPVGEIERTIRASAGRILEELEMFDIYRGPQLGENVKSVAYSLKMRTNDRTLTDEECDGVIKKILESLAKIGAGIRN